MPGTKEGGKKAAATNLERHGRNFYRRIGAMGGSRTDTKPKGFAANPELAREAGRKGGKISKRGPAKRFSADKIAKIKEELAEAEARKNLQGEELAKCIQALDNWNRNYKWSSELHMATIRRTDEEQ